MDSLSSKGGPGGYLTAAAAVPAMAGGVAIAAGGEGVVPLGPAGNIGGGGKALKGIKTKKARRGKPAAANIALDGT